jgi:hypothetical protein
MVCHGFSYFEGGELILFKSDKEPRNNHVIQLWQTPFCSSDYTPPAIDTESFYYKIGNKEIVRCMSGCQTVLSLLFKDDSYANLYIDITREADSILDAYFWIDKSDAYGLRDTLSQIRSIAASAVEEFDKVNKLRKSTSDTISKVRSTVEELLQSSTLKDLKSIEQFVSSLARLRSLRGEILSLKQLKYADIPLIEQLELSVKERMGQLSDSCIEFLLTPEGLLPYRNRTDEIRRPSRLSRKQLKGKRGKKL